METLFWVIVILGVCAALFALLAWIADLIERRFGGDGGWF